MQRGNKTLQQMRGISLEATEQGKEPAGLFGAEVDVWAGGQLGQPSIQWP